VRKDGERNKGKGRTRASIREPRILTVASRSRSCFEKRRRRDQPLVWFERKERGGVDEHLEIRSILVGEVGNRLSGSSSSSSSTCSTRTRKSASPWKDNAEPKEIERKTHQSYAHNSAHWSGNRNSPPDPPL